MTVNPEELEIHRKFMRPIRTRPFLAIAIPSSITVDSKTLREQTLKIGYIGRAAAIFRVEEIMIYNDGEGNPKTLHSLLSYMEVPPYLKKILVPLLPELRYAGVAPPLKTPHHVQPEFFDTRFREGVITHRQRDKCLVELGLGKKGLIYGKCPSKGSRVTVKILKEDARYYHVELVERDKIDIYWGYSVKVFGSLRHLLETQRGRETAVIVATKKGEPIHRVEEDLYKLLEYRNWAVVIFGGPYLDVDEIALRENFSLSNYVDLLINFVPRQGTINIRVEEAIIAALSILNYIKEKHFNG
uniref:RNA-binding protein n=1 Tax=Ignisphaera aggregans TaxID=334771 RepID=A0A7C2ZNN5_9CREN